MQVGISVIIPVYNVEAYVRECLDSVLNQSFEDYEIICVNDGSTDNSGMILEEYEKRSDKLRVIYQENKGLSEARNTGIRHATGKYICFLDSDDLLVQDALKKMWVGAEEAGSDILTYEIHSCVYENDCLKKTENKSDRWCVKGEYEGIREGRDFLTDRIEHNDFIFACWLLLIRSAWLRRKGISFCPGMLYEDTIFSVECYLQCERMRHLKEGLYIYRIRENSIMTQKYTYKHLYSSIWEYSEYLRIICQCTKSEREKNAILTIARAELRKAKVISRNLSEKEYRKMDNLSGLYTLLAENMGILRSDIMYNDRLRIEGLLSELKKCEKIILYGAGIIGNKVKDYILQNGFGEKLLGFAVSKKTDDIREDGICVKQISEYEVSEKVLLIISAQEAYHKDMLEKAEACGYRNICLIDCELESLLEQIF